MRLGLTGRKRVATNTAVTALISFGEQVLGCAGGAAHLPGMIASITTLPVIGVPIKSSNSIDGWDSVLSILQMPNGVPVATVALNASRNAGILAAQIIAAFDEKLAEKIYAYKEKMKKEVQEKVQHLQSAGWPNTFDKNPSK